MSVSILEALQNAQANLDNMKMIGLGILPLIQGQLHNSITLLEKGYSVDEEIEPLLKKYGTIENVPEKDE